MNQKFKNSTISWKSRYPVRTHGLSIVKSGIHTGTPDGVVDTIVLSPAEKEIEPMDLSMAIPLEDIDNFIVNIIDVSGVNKRALAESLLASIGFHCVLLWGIEDIQSIDPLISDEDAAIILQQIEEEIDAEYGVTWETLGRYINNFNSCK